MGTNKIVVYTCVIGGFDSSWSHKIESDKIDFVIFTDKKESFYSCPYTIRVIPIWNKDKRRTSREVKIRPHLYLENYEYSIWLDGNIFLLKDPISLIETYLKDHNLCLLQHRTESKKCIAHELGPCTRLRKDDPDVMKNQVDGYFEEGFPKDYGMYETGILLRRHNEKDVINTMETWWEEVKTKSKRDQLSFTYACWKNNFKFNSMPSLMKKETNSIFKFTVGHR